MKLFFSVVTNLNNLPVIVIGIDLEGIITCTNSRTLKNQPNCLATNITHFKT